MSTYENLVALLNKPNLLDLVENPAELKSLVNELDDYEAEGIHPDTLEAQEIAITGERDEWSAVQGWVGISDDEQDIIRKALKNEWRSDEDIEEAIDNLLALLPSLPWQDLDDEEDEEENEDENQISRIEPWAVLDAIGLATKSEFDDMLNDDGLMREHLIRRQFEPLQSADSEPYCNPTSGLVAAGRRWSELDTSERETVLEAILCADYSGDIESSKIRSILDILASVSQLPESFGEEGEANNAETARVVARIVIASIKIGAMTFEDAMCMTLALLSDKRGSTRASAILNQLKQSLVNVWNNKAALQTGISDNATVNQIEELIQSNDLKGTEQAAAENVENYVPRSKLEERKPLVERIKKQRDFFVGVLALIAVLNFSGDRIEIDREESWASGTSGHVYHVKYSWWGLSQTRTRIAYLRSSEGDYREWQSLDDDGHWGPYFYFEDFGPEGSDLYDRY